MSITTEYDIQATVIEWAEWKKNKYPCLKLMYHTPNEGKRAPATGANLKRIGMKPGVPDICLPVARGGYHALYIELKTEDGSLSKEQKDYLHALDLEGNCTYVCRSAIDAIKRIELYITGGERI